MCFRSMVFSMDNGDVKMVEAKIELERISELQKYKEEFIDAYESINALFEE